MTSNKFLLLLLVAVGVIATGCDHEKNVLAESVAKLQKECPLNQGNLGMLDGVSYDKDVNHLLLKWTLNTDYMDINELKDGNEESADQIFRLISQSQQVRPLLNAAVAADARVVLKFSAFNDEKEKYSYSAEGVKKVLDMPRLTDTDVNQILLKNYAKIVSANNANSQPYEGQCLRNAEMTDGYLVFGFQLDGIRRTVADLRNTKNLKDIVKHDFKEEYGVNYVMKQNVKMLETLGYGIKYRFMDGNPNNFVEVEITPQEIHNISMLD